MILETLIGFRNLRRMLPEIRASVLPARHPSEPGAWWGVEPSATGLDIDEWTALANTPLYAGINLIAGTLSCLTPLVDTLRDDGKFDRDETHWLWQILHEEPNPEITAEIFIYTQTINKLLYGDRYAEIERRPGDGQPRHLWHIRSSRVTPKRIFKRLGGGLTELAEESTPEDRKRGGELLYEVHDGADTVWLTRLEMFHVPSFTLTGVRGNSIVTLHKETVAIGLALQSSAAAIFGNSAAPLVAIERPAEAVALSPEGVRARLAAWEASLRGIHRRGRATVLQEGEEAKTLDLKLNELQFIENLKHNVPEVARILNLDPFWLGHEGTNNTYANVEHRMLDLKQRTLLPHTKAEKAEIWRKLVPSTEAATLRVRHEFKELLEPDSQMRSIIQQRYLDMGVETIDAISRHEGAPGVPDSEGGSVRWMGGNRRPIAQALADPPARGGAPEIPSGRADSLLRARLGRSLEASLQRAVRREAREIRRAVEESAPDGLDALLGRVDRLYERELPEFVAELASPALGDDAPTFARRYAVAHRAELRSRIGDKDPSAVVNLIDRWLAEAARSEAAREIERLTEGA